jgi:nitroreductase
MELRDALYGRRAIRQFTPEPVARPVLERLIDAAIQAPSAINAQPWHFTVISKASLLDSIAVEAKAYMLRLAVVSDFPNHFRTTLAADDYHIFYHAPVLAVISARSGEWAMEDASLAAQNFMLAAYAEGLGSCWIGFAQAWLKTKDGRRAIGLEDEYLPVAPIIVGHPAQPVPPVPRQPARTRWFN